MAGAEVAFAGRSNVGKSSLINALTGRKALARTSHTPGRTLELIFFPGPPHLTLVDIHRPNLERFRRRHGPDPRVTVSVSSAARVPEVPTGSQDRVLIADVLCDVRPLRKGSTGAVRASRRQAGLLLRLLPATVSHLALVGE